MRVLRAGSSTGGSCSLSYHHRTPCPSKKERPSLSSRPRRPPTSCAGVQHARARAQHDFPLAKVLTGLRYLAARAGSRACWRPSPSLAPYWSVEPFEPCVEFQAAFSRGARRRRREFYRVRRSARRRRCTAPRPRCVSQVTRQSPILASLATIWAANITIRRNLILIVIPRRRATRRRCSQLARLVSQSPRPPNSMMTRII